MNEWNGMVELYDRGEAAVHGEVPVRVPLCPPQIPHGMIWY